MPLCDCPVLRLESCRRAPYVQGGHHNNHVSSTIEACCKVRATVRVHTLEAGFAFYINGSDSFWFSTLLFAKAISSKFMNQAMIPIWWIILPRQDFTRDQYSREGVSWRYLASMLPHQTARFSKPFSDQPFDFILNLECVECSGAYSKSILRRENALFMGGDSCDEVVLGWQNPCCRPRLRRQRNKNKKNSTTCIRISIHHGRGRSTEKQRFDWNHWRETWRSEALEAPRRQILVHVQAYAVLFLLRTSFTSLDTFPLPHSSQLAPDAGRADRHCLLQALPRSGDHSISIPMT